MPCLFHIIMISDKFDNIVNITVVYQIEMKTNFVDELRSVTSWGGGGFTDLARYFFLCVNLYF